MIKTFTCIVILLTNMVPVQDLDEMMSISKKMTKNILAVLYFFVIINVLINLHFKPCKGHQFVTYVVF